VYTGEEQIVSDSHWLFSLLPPMRFSFFLVVFSALSLFVALSTFATLACLKYKLQYL